MHGIYNFGNPLKCGKSSSLHIDERALSSNGFLFLLEARLECFDGPKIFTIEQSHAGYNRRLTPYRFSTFVSKVGFPGIKTYYKDCNRPFLKHPRQLHNRSAAPWWPENTKI